MENRRLKKYQHRKRSAKYFKNKKLLKKNLKKMLDHQMDSRAFLKILHVNNIKPQHFFLFL
ncbi:MAG: hypothetical protein RL757_28 [Bacteroidota bacterium]|jgi:ribosomal protein L13